MVLVYPTKSAVCSKRSACPGAGNAAALQITHLVPAEDSAVLKANRHSVCSARVNGLIDVEDGGTMRDSDGRVIRTATTGMRKGTAKLRAGSIAPVRWERRGPASSSWDTQQTSGTSIPYGTLVL